MRGVVLVPSLHTLGGGSDHVYSESSERRLRVSIQQALCAHGKGAAHSTKKPHTTRVSGYNRNQGLFALTKTAPQTGAC